METTTCRRAVEVRRMTGLLSREDTDRLAEVAGDVYTYRQLDDFFDAWLFADGVPAEYP